MAIDESGRAFGIVAVDAAARPVADAWWTRLRELGRPVQTWFGPTPPLDAWLAAARVGYRLLLAGPEADLLALRARAGVLLDAEITLHVTDSRERVVRCARCRTATRTEAAVLDCAGCGLRLAVHDHVSTVHGAHLGSWSGA